MSPFVPGEIARAEGFPRVSGDEPDLTRLVDKPNVFSPRERG